jgi:hypothetical protein
MRLYILVGVLSIALLALPSDARAICGLDGAVFELLRSLEDPNAARSLSLNTHQYGTCSVCHLVRSGGPRNEFGNAVNSLLTFRDREDPSRQREVGRRMKDLLANPSLANSPTFGELFEQGRFPASSLANPMPPLLEGLASGSPSVTAEQARELVKNTQAESRFGILQLSQPREVDAEVAETLAEFRGEMLMLGVRSLSPEVAAALAKSQAANVWLHSVTSVSPEAAEALVQLRGHLILTSLTELDSVPLATKLATRPGALSFPYLKTITPEVAAALAKNERSLTLAGLTEISPELQEALAETIGALSLPNLRSLDSVPLTKKLAGATVLLSNVEALTGEQMELLVGVKGQASFWGGVYLPLAVFTPEIAEVVAANPRPVNLTLFGTEFVSDEVLRTLMKSRLNVTLQDMKRLTAEQIRMVSEELANITFRAGVVQRSRLSLPQLQDLDSALLAETLVKSTGFQFPRVTSISPDAAAALGNLPDEEFRHPDGRVESRPRGDLNFPSLETLSPETAQLLLKKRWLSISFPALQDVSLETVRLMARQTFRLNLGIASLPPECADAFAETPTDANMGGGYLLFPNVNDLSPEAASILVNSLNRGVLDLGYTKLSNSPKLYFGGDFGFPSSGFSSLSPELAMELAKYEGVLAIQGLGELPDESAAALASFSGPYLILSGPGAEQLSPAAAASLAKTPGVLQIQLRHLDSVPLAERFARQIHWTLSNLETVSNEAAPALSEYQQFFNLRALTVLESPELARRFVEGTTAGHSITLPALSTLSPEAAEILAAGSKPLHLGLTVLDSPAVARALAKSRSGLNLPRLRAATTEVIDILKLSESDLYVLSGDVLSGD